MFQSQQFGIYAIPHSLAPKHKPATKPCSLWPTSSPWRFLPGLIRGPQFRTSTPWLSFLPLIVMTTAFHNIIPFPYFKCYQPAPSPLLMKSHLFPWLHNIPATRCAGRSTQTSQALLQPPPLPGTPFLLLGQKEIHCISFQT